MTGQEETEGYTSISFTFQSEPGYYVPCTLLVPKGVDKPIPGVICLQGHSTGAHISLGKSIFEGDDELIAGGRDFAVRAVKEGFCAIVMEQRYMGDLGGLIAPRLAVIVCGVEDDIFPLAGVEKSYAVMRNTYESIGKGERCRLVKGQGGHQFYPDDAWPVAKELFGTMT